MVPEKPDPKTPKGIRTLQHDLHQPAGMPRAMKGERQLQHMLEIIAEHAVALLVRQPVGIECHQRAADDGEKPKRDPQA